jgi:hypothetical protein
MGHCPIIRAMEVPIQPQCNILNLLQSISSISTVTKNTTGEGSFKESKMLGVQVRGGTKGMMAMLLFIAIMLNVIQTSYTQAYSHTHEKDDNDNDNNNNDDNDGGNEASNKEGDNNEWNTFSFKRSLDTCDIDNDVPLSPFQSFTLLYRYSNHTPSLPSLQALMALPPSQTHIRLFPSSPSPSPSPSPYISDTAVVGNATNINSTSIPINGDDVDGRRSTEPLLAPPKGVNITSIDLVFSDMTLNTTNTTMYYCAPLMVNFTSKVYLFIDLSNHQIKFVVTFNELCMNRCMSSK